MRTYTLAFSIVVHLLILGILVVSPILATTVLPDPHRPVVFVEVRAVPAPHVPALRRPSGGPAGVRGGGHAAPVIPPAAITPETGREAFDADVPDGGIPGGGSGEFPGGGGGDVPAPPPPPAEKAVAPIRVGGAIQPPQKIRDVAPIYPTVAQAARIEGTVILEAVIGDDGRVRSLRVLRSVRLLDAAAMEAVRQWQFTPTRLNGTPVPVVMTVTVTFQLQR